MTPSNAIYPFAIEDPDAAPSARSGLPVVVIGAGPVGLAAAAHLLDRGLEPLVLEAGSQVGANIAQWRHVRLFSPWCLALDPVSVRLLEQAGWSGPDPDALPTGADLLERYLAPLAALPALASRIRLHTTVVAVARRDLDKVRSPGRDQLPFQVRVRDRDGRLADLQARAVIDASGTWTQPNPLGASGLPALGEPDAGARITYGLPNIAGHDRDRYAGQRTVVVGAGHSAATSLLALAELQQQALGTEVVWAVRSATPRPLVGKGSAEADELPARGRPATDLAALVEAGRIELVSGFRIHTVEPASDRVRLAGDHFQGDDVIHAQNLVVEADEVIAATASSRPSPQHPAGRRQRTAGRRRTGVPPPAGLACRDEQPPTAPCIGIATGREQHGDRGQQDGRAPAGRRGPQRRPPGGHPRAVCPRAGPGRPTLDRAVPSQLPRRAHGDRGADRRRRQGRRPLHLFGHPPGGMARPGSDWAPLRAGR